MDKWYLIFLFSCISLVLILKILTFFRKGKELTPIDLEDVSVIIPFRNECENLPSLFESITTQKQLPKEIIFVNDHSEDESVEQVEAYLLSNIKVRLLSLSTAERGKKSALLKGVEAANGNYIITLDADVKLNGRYFETLSIAPTHSLLILPVITKGKNFFGNFFSTEYLFLNAFNYLLAPFYPISSSGANLGFNKSAVNYKKQYENHNHLSSGDDYFLLKALRSEKKSIHVSNNVELSVVTGAPESITAYWKQRVRWFGKSHYQARFGETLFGLFTLLYFAGGMTALIYAAYYGHWIAFTLIFGLRLLLDILVFVNYSFALKQGNKATYLPLFQLIYPVLMVGVMLTSLFYKPKWKGRAVEV